MFGLRKKFKNMTRKPVGLLGRLMAIRMNNGHHVALANWGMQEIPALDDAQNAGHAISEPREGTCIDHGTSERRLHICDLGCGGGRNVKELLRRYPEAFVMGVDYSEISVSEASRVNRKALRNGRADIIKGDVSKLDIPDASFDLVTAVETIYFWPGLERCFSEVRRTLKPGGHFLIINEDDGEDKESNQRIEQEIKGLKIYTAAEIEAALRAAGFDVISTKHHDARPWITVLAR